MTRLFKSIIRLFPPVVVVFGYIGFQVWLTYYNFFSSPPLPDGLPAESGISETLVVACAQDDDMSWLDRHHFPVAKVTYSRSSKGNEAFAYLEYIVENYDRLSDITIFIHNQESAWHNARLFSLRTSRMLTQLDREFVRQAGYFNLRCEWEPGCPARLNFTAPESEDAELEAMRRVWPDLHPDHPDLPDVLAQPCCSQFAASREGIRSLPLDRWVHFRDWVLAQTEMKSWLIGRLWEYTWQFVLGSVTTWCPSERDCYCYGYGVCFEDGNGPGSWEEMRAVEKEAAELKEAYMIALGQTGKQGSNDGPNSALHEKILATEARLEEMLEAAMKNGADTRASRDARVFRVS